jgi:transcriptional regulator with XRE-family HTH domain
MTASLENLVREETARKDARLEQEVRDLETALRDSEDLVTRKGGRLEEKGGETPRCDEKEDTVEGAEINRRAGELMKHLRKQAGMSQEKLAGHLGVTYQQVQKYERGDSGLTLRRMAQVALALGIPADEFLRRVLTETGVPTARAFVVTLRVKGSRDRSPREVARSVASCVRQTEGMTVDFAHAEEALQGGRP